MKNDTIRSKEGAHELLQRLEQFYGEPVLPLGNFCHAMELWMDCIVRNNTDPTLIQEGINHGQKYFEFLNLMEDRHQEIKPPGSLAVRKGTPSHPHVSDSQRTLERTGHVF